MVKAGPPFLTSDQTFEQNLVCYPGTIIRAAEPPAASSGIAVAGAGVTRGEPSPLPAWTFTGTLNAQQFLPGDNLRLSGTLRIVSPALRTADTINVRTLLYLERLSRPDGLGSLGHNTFASVLLTPTDLPIEGAGFLQRYPWSVSQQFTLSKREETRVESAIDLSYLVPADAPIGFYRPSVCFIFENVPEKPITDIWPVLNRASRYPGGMYLPIIRIGNPAAPRFFWTLLTDDLSNGTRGTRAVEDQTRFGLASRVVTQSETFIVPRTDAASGRPIRYRLEPFCPDSQLGKRRISAEPSVDPVPVSIGPLACRSRMARSTSSAPHRSFKLDCGAWLTRTPGNWAKAAAESRTPTN